VGRARRAWLPPSATWLFRPRNATHTTGAPTLRPPLHQLLAMANDRQDHNVHHITARAQLQMRKIAQGLLRAAIAPSGGWYFEFPSAGREHPAWLPPTAMVLRAAFETLEVRA
jgi:hypothetical protein